MKRTATRVLDDFPIRSLSSGALTAVRGGGEVVRTGFSDSGVSIQNRAIEHHSQQSSGISDRQRAFEGAFQPTGR